MAWPTTSARFLAVLPLVACSKAEPVADGVVPSAGVANAVAAAPSATLPTRPAGPRPSTSVSLDGALHAAAIEPGKRIYARSLRAWIHSRPSRSADRLGYFRAGSSLLVTGPIAGTEGVDRLLPESMRDTSRPAVPWGAETFVVPNS